MAHTTRTITQEELVELDLAGELNELEDSDSSDDGSIFPFDEGTDFKPLECDLTPELDGSYPKSKLLLRLLAPYNIFNRFWTDKIMNEVLKYTQIDDLRIGELRVFSEMPFEGSLV